MIVDRFAMPNRYQHVFQYHHSDTNNNRPHFRKYTINRALLHIAPAPPQALVLFRLQRHRSYHSFLFYENKFYYHNYDRVHQNLINVSFNGSPVENIKFIYISRMARRRCCVVLVLCCRAVHILSVVASLWCLLLPVNK